MHGCFLQPRKHLGVLTVKAKLSIILIVILTLVTHKVYYKPNYTVIFCQLFCSESDYIIQ